MILPWRWLFLSHLSASGGSRLLLLRRRPVVVVPLLPLLPFLLLVLIFLVLLILVVVVQHVVAVVVVVEVVDLDVVEVGRGLRRVLLGLHAVLLHGGGHDHLVLLRLARRGLHLFPENAQKCIQSR